MATRPYPRMTKQMIQQTLGWNRPDLRQHAQLSQTPSSPSLIYAIAQAYGGPYLLAALFKLIQDMLQFTQPQLLRRLLSFADSFSPGNQPEPAYHGYLIAGLMFGCGLIQTLFLHQYFDRTIVTGIRATGDIVNLMSTDVSRIQESCSNGIILLSGLFQITLAFITAKTADENKDSRTRLMNEILNNIRSIKLYSWENAFTKKLFAIRNERELGTLRQIGLPVQRQHFTMEFHPVSGGFFGLFDLLTRHNFALSTLQFPLAVLPMVINLWVEAYVSANRICKFLMSKELQQDAVARSEYTTEEHQAPVEIPPFRESVLVCPRENLLAVVGRVGSGKSSLLSGILGEMFKLSGTVELRGKVAYAAQTPWLLSATLKENILFGADYDKDLYDSVIEACALVDDLAMLRDGDQTQVGEKGIALSGGQKARISLARTADELVMVREGKIVERGTFQSNTSQDDISDDLNPSEATMVASENSSKSFATKQRQESVVLMKRPSVTTSQNNKREFLKSRKAPGKYRSTKKKAQSSTMYTNLLESERGVGCRDCVGLSGRPASLIDHDYIVAQELEFKATRVIRRPGTSPRLLLGIYGVLGFLTVHTRWHHLNRFSRDVFVIDEVLARVFSGFLRTSAGVATIRAFGEQGRFVTGKRDQSRPQPGGMFRFGWCKPLASCAIRIDRKCDDPHCSIAGSDESSREQTSRQREWLGLDVIRTFNHPVAHWLVRSATEVETNIVSCERVVEYTKLKQEGPWETDEHDRPSPSWPAKGEIVYEGVECRYREGLDLVLKGVDFKVQAQQKIGICGRTGAGKSTITLSLFRLIEKAAGRILIDGVDISKIGLNDLRSKISIIPQDSQCFEGSLRANLDPEGLKTDEELWRVLEHSKLKAHIQSLEGGLDARIEEGGNNLSNGQRQLLCLSRAMLLKSSKILVMDEATSSVDPETDSDIQTVIRNEFKSFTILVIAHRLNTILDCDKILVINKGKVVEFDSPDNLMKNKDSEFSKMCQEAGLID
ncbi:hypothetical protein H4Q26_002651 [Puccinia striiformis f. sp. tritici PST-130]|nr:hypothetical protein H4Q26_002651 [Puccinia striiformis f. sp. tritici PST-130]